MSGGGKPSAERVATIMRRHHLPRYKYGTQAQFFKACGTDKVYLRKNGDERGTGQMITVEELFAHFKARLVNEADR